jgi:serine/threonine protein kinase
MNPTVVNELLKKSTKLSRFVVTDRFPDEPTIFNASDTTDPAKKIIVKITSFPLGADPELPQLQRYVQLSENCNICKLLEYELVPPHFLITVMENCGTDLFYFITKDRDKLNLNIILSIALDLLNQIICLQTHNALHGDIKIENVLFDDDTSKATLVDFDKLPVIQKQDDGTFRVSDLISTEYTRGGRTAMARVVQSYSRNYEFPDTIQIIMHILSLPRKLIVSYVRMDEYSLLSNIPPGIYDERRKSSILTFPNQESVNIIDLYSWGYVILILIYYSKSISNEFSHRALVVIIMNIILPNGDMPNGDIKDVFDNPINADYLRKLGLGITALLQYPVPDESCTNYKVRVFLDLIQKCESVENLLEQFQRALSDEAFESKQAKFDEEFERMQKQIELEKREKQKEEKPRWRGKQEEEESGGARRRRTHKKKHRPKRKASKFKRTKRGTRRMRMR